VALLVDEKVGALPVVDSDRRVLGIITYIDVLTAWQREHEAIEVPALLPTTAELEDRALTGRGERHGVPAGMARRGGPKRAPPKRGTPKKAAPDRSATRR
jgi:hypothetical protein